MLLNGMLLILSIDNIDNIGMLGLLVRERSIVQSSSAAPFIKDCAAFFPSNTPPLKPIRRMNKRD
jgi:hypothetical protein